MRISVILLLIIIVTPALSQSPRDCSNPTVYMGYISGDMNIWKKAMTEVKDTYMVTSDPCHIFTFIEARYGYIAYLIGIDKKDEAKPLVDTFESDIETLAAYPQYNAEREAFRVALLGFRMGLNPAKAFSLGPKALKQLDLAMEVGRNNAAVWIEKANSEANMPAFAGGSKTKAIGSLNEALRLFESDPDLSPYNWRYLHTIVLLGQTYEKTGDYVQACEAYRKALKREPSFIQVRDEFLPAAEKKLKQGLSYTTGS